MIPTTTYQQQPLQPMPPNGLQHMQSIMTSYGQPGMLDNLEPPKHVVGSQDRRGILPSAPGRPAVTATGTGSTKNTMIPSKDADGKFPCPHKPATTMLNENDMMAANGCEVGLEHLASTGATVYIGVDSVMAWWG